MYEAAEIAASSVAFESAAPKNANYYRKFDKNQNSMLSYSSCIICGATVYSPLPRAHVLFLSRISLSLTQRDIPLHDVCQRRSRSFMPLYGNITVEGAPSAPAPYRRLSLPSPYQVLVGKGI